MKKDNKEIKNIKEIVEEAQFYIMNHKYSKAIEILQKGLKEDEENPIVHYHLGICFEALNRLDEAKKEFRRALEIKPDFEEAKKHLDKLIGE